MTTVTFTSVIDQSTDAAFRAWGSEFNTNLAAVGLVQTSDTGQINWTTAVRPLAGAAAGYEIWRFSDSTIYVKIEYGAGAGVSQPQIWITAGTGSNGSGTLTGQLSTRSTFATGSTPNSTSTNYTSYFCHTTSALSLVWKVNGGSGLYPLAFLCIGKTVDSTGSATTQGYGVLRCSTSAGIPSLQSVRLTSVATTNNDTVNFIVFPGNPISSQTGSNIQAYLCWVNVHDVQPFSWACGYVITEQLRVTPFSLSLVSTPSHTYLPIGQLGSLPTLNGQSGTTYSLAFLYE